MLDAVAILGNRVMRWRAALHLAVSAVILAAFGLPLAPAAHAAAPVATLSVSSTWQTGFIGHFTIVNYSTVPLTDWTIEFDMPVGQSVSHTWSSNIAQSGTHYVLTPVNWNRIIPPGGTAKGGMRGVLSGTYTPPLNCVLNRQYLCS